MLIISFESSKFSSEEIKNFSSKKILGEKVLSIKSKVNSFFSLFMQKGGGII